MTAAHRELCRHLQAAIDDAPDRGPVTYGTARPGRADGEGDPVDGGGDPVDGGGDRADDTAAPAHVVVLDDDGDPVLVVVTGHPDDHVDPANDDHADPPSDDNAAPPSDDQVDSNHDDNADPPSDDNADSNRDDNAAPPSHDNADSNPDDHGDRDVDPYAPAVVRRAVDRAREVGAPLCCTYGRDRLVAFDASEAELPLLDRSAKSYPAGDAAAAADALLDAGAGLAAGDTDWDPPDEVFVDRVRTLHEHVSPRLRAALADHLEADEEFGESFVAWTAAQGVAYRELDAAGRASVRRQFTRQAAYLLLGEPIFDAMLGEVPTDPGDVDPLAVGSDGADRRGQFERHVGTADVAATDGHGEMYDEVPLDPVAEELRAFADELADQDLAQFDSDVVGRIYEGVIPPERRRALGEYYTPPAVCDLVVRLAVTDADDRVLDPACGSGGFLVSAYHRLRDLLPDPDGSHGRILGQLSGVEVNPFPAHLTAVNLAVQDPAADARGVDVAVADFFDVEGSRRREGGDHAEAAGQLGEFDAVVANPPYVRQEDVADKDHVRDHLADVDAEYVSRRADVYAYFLTHATEFLAEGGDLGFVTSDRWLDTKYGEDVQRFVLENFEIRAVVTFDRQVFEDALVDSSVLLLRRRSDRRARDANVATFLRLREPLDVETVASLVEREHDPDRMVSTEQYRLVTREQAALRDRGKWNVLFSAPPTYFDVAASPNVVRLSEVADVTRGVTTGANDFFCGRAAEMRDRGLAPYTGPLLKATGQVDGVGVTDADAGEWAVLDVHDLVRRALDGTDGASGRSALDRVETWLRDNGHRALLEHVRRGEERGYHERSTLQSRDVWFDLGRLPRPRILATMFTWRVHRVHWNEPGAATSDQFYAVVPEDGVDEAVLCGVLNSRVVALANELLGRRAGGEGMTRLQTKVYEAERWPVPDPREMSERHRRRIRKAFHDLVQREAALDDPTPAATETERDALDRAVVATLGLDADEDAVLEGLKRGLDATRGMREAGGGRWTTVPLDRARRVDGETGAADLPGVGRTTGTTTADDR